MKIDVPTLLRWVRQRFPSYFNHACPNEVKIVDALVVAHAALLLAIRSESLLGAHTTQDLKAKTNALENDYTSLREMIKVTDAFSKMSEEEKKLMDSELFTIPFES